MEQLLDKLTKEEVEQFFSRFERLSLDPDWQNIAPMDLFSNEVLQKSKDLGIDWTLIDFRMLASGEWFKYLVLRAADEALSRNSLSQDDRVNVRYSRWLFSETLTDLLALCEKGRSTDLRRSDIGYIKTLALLAVRAAFVIGATAEIPNGYEQFLRTDQAALARAARAKKPRETALRDAIAAERGEGAAAQPAKEAAAILDAVNARLAAADFPPVKVDVIYRRLKNNRS